MPSATYKLDVLGGKALWRSGRDLPLRGKELAVFLLVRVPSDRKRESHKVAERTGLEPATSRVTGERSNQLNYHSKMRPV